MYNEEDRKWLYEQMKQSGVDTGSYDDFKQSLNNQEDREWYYNKSKELKLDVGSQQDFDDMMVEPVAAQPQQPASPAPTPMQPAQSTPINGYKQPQFDASKLQRPDQRTDLEKTFDMIHGQLKQANQQQAQENDEFWRNDPTMQQRQQYNQRNGIALDPTVPSDQRGIRLGVQRPSALDMGNPRYASIIKNDEAVNAGMDVFGKELQRIEEAGRQHLKDAAGRNTPSTSPDGYLGPDMATMREASEISDPSLAIQSAVDQMTAKMLQDDYFTTDGENLNDAGRYALQTMQQRMIQQLVEKRMPQSSAEYIVLNAIRNSDFGKLTRMATSTPFQNYLDDLAAQSYQPGFWERVGTGALTFGLNMPEYALTGAAGGGLSKFMTGGLTKIVTNGLVRRGVERSVAERAAQMVMSNTLTGRAAQIGSTAVHGATTFGLQPVIGTPVDLTYKAGQPINPDGSAFTPELDDYIGETWKEMKKGAAMGTLMVGGTVAAVPEKIAQGAVKEGLIRGALGFGYDAGVMAGFSLHDMKEADPTFEITPESAAEAYAESAASLGLLKLPHIFGMKGQVEQARQAQKFKFTPEEKQYLRDMGIDDPVELALRMANRGAEQPSFLKSILRNDERTPQAQTGKEIVKDDAEPIDAENMQQLSAAYRSFMASEAPETMKAKVMYLIEGKMPAQFSPVTGTRIVEDGSKIYVETLNQRGGVIERKPMRSYEEALAEQNRLGFQADMNTTEAIQNRLDELETATDMSNMLKESYEAIRRKAVSDPDKLTAEDRELLSMAQNIPAILQKANEGTELTPSEQSLLNAAFSRLNAYKQKNGAGKRIAAEVEGMYDLNVGEVERAMYGHSKAEAEELAGGNGIVEIGNGIYRTEQEQQIVSEYRQRMLQRIQEHEALHQTETEAQTQEGTVQQPVDTSRMIEGEVPQEPVADTPPPPADTEVDNGGGESKYTAPSFDIETSRQRGRDAYYTQDQPTIKSIGHEMKMADVRMFRYFPSEEAMRIDEAVKTGNLESIDTESMTVQQRDAFVKYVNAYAEAEGFKAAMEEHHQQQAALDEAAIEPYRNEAGEIIPLTLDNGQQAYHKSGDLANKFGTVTVTYTDETGQPKTTNWPVSKIKEQGTAMPAGQFAERLSADLAEQSGNRVMNWLLGNNVEAGQQVELTIAGETMPFTVDGFYPDGDIQLSDGDGNIMKMTKEEVLNMMEATDQLQIETQLQQEAAQFREAQRQQREADRQAEIAQRTERYNNGIVGMKEGNPDFTAEGSDPAVVAEYLLGSSRQQEQTIAEVKPQVINDIQQSKDELKTRQTEAQQELSRVISQLSVGKDILDTDEAQQLEQRQAELEAELQDLDARQRRWADVRSNLMTKEEVQQFETERRSDVSQARKGLRPAEQNRNFGQNDEHIAVNEDGTMNFGLTPTGNANNYLLRHFQDSFDAEKFMNDQRIALRNKQRDEVQPQIDALNGQLNDYISGRIELTPEELKQISQSVTDLEAYQDALTREASHMREIVEGISELYERNGRNEPSTPQEKRMEAMSKARSAQDKLRIAREIYKDDPQAISAINDMEPRDIAEYISQNLGRGTINWEGFDRGDHHVRGLREELGSGWERGISRGKSTNAFNMYLAAEGHGKGIEEIVHDLYEAQPDMNGGGKMYSTEDLRNGIIDLLSTARTPSDISHLTINNRIAEAEQYVRAMEEYEEREAELAELGMPDNDAIREWIPSVSEQEYTPEVIAYLDGAFADYIESLGGDRETYEDAMRQLAADEELTFNEIAEYERNEPAADGQRPSGTSNRVDEKPVTAGVPEGSNQGKEDLSATQAHDNDGHPAIEAGQPQQSAPESGTAGSGESLAVQPQGGIEKGKKSNIQGLETYSEDEILNQVRDYFDVVRGDNDADAEIVGMKIIGSRTNGTANDDSDLDVLLEYKGNAREDDLFNMLSGTDEPLTIEGLRVDINPITKGKSGTIEEFMRRNADYRKETPAVFKDRLETAKADTNTEPTEAQKKAGNYKMGHVEFGGYKMSIENPKGSVRSGVDQNGKPWSIEMKDTYGYIGKKYGADGDHLDFFINDDADLDNFKGRVYVVDQKNEDGTFDEHKVMYGYPTWGEAKKAYERNYEPGWWDKHVMQMLAVPKDRFDKWLSESDRKTKPYADYFRLKYDNPISDPIEEVKANIRERQNSIMDHVKQSASVVQARAEAAIQKKEPTLKPADIKSMTDDELQKSRKKRSSVASTARFLLGTTNIEKGGEKWNTLQETIRQQQADMDAIDDELQSRRERSREELENVLTDRETGGALVEHLQDMGIDVTTDVRENRRIRKQAENDQSENGELRRMHTPDGKTYGFAYRGKLYLDPRKIDGNLPIHEYAHLWSEALRKLNPESWNNVVSLIKADADTWRFVQERNPEITDENALVEEVIATASGERGQERLKAEYERMSKLDGNYTSKWGNIWKNISKALQDFWKQVTDFLHINYKSAAQVYDQVLKDFVDGVNPRRKVEDWLERRNNDYMEAVQKGEKEKASAIFMEALKEEVGNGITPFVAVDKYRNVSSLAKRVKSRDAEAVREVAEMMKHLIPENAVLVPVPSHTGEATDMLDVAKVLGELTGSEVADVLKGAPRASQYDTKKETGAAISSSDLGIRMEGQLPEGKLPIIIDNVVDTGNTAEACVQALGRGVVVSLGRSVDDTRHAATLKSADPIVTNRRGDVVPLDERFDLGGSKYMFRPYEDMASEPVPEREVASVVKMEPKSPTDTEKREAKVRQAATKAVLSALDNAGVKYKVVSQEEANQMMSIYAAVTEEPIVTRAKKFRPYWQKRYAVVNTLDPYAVPQYFEKKRLALEHTKWANRGNGKKYTMVDMGYPDEVAGGLSNAAQIAEMIQPMVGWHGSGAVFTVFDHSHMGEGQGSQMFGWGTYLSNSRRIGEDYADMSGEGWKYKNKSRKEVLAGKSEMPEGRYNRDEELVADIMRQMEYGRTFDDAQARLIKDIDTDIKNLEENISDLSEGDLKDLQGFKDEKSFVESLNAEDFTKKPANLYKVDIPEDTGSNYLDWMTTIKKPLRKKIADAVRKLDGEPAQSVVYANYKEGWQTIANLIEREPLAYKEIHDRLLQAFGGRLADAEKVSKLMSEAGFTGVKYPAGTIMGDGDGATNYVIFNENDAKITEHIQFMFEEPEAQEHGQPMFQKGQNGKIYGWTDGQQIYLTEAGLNPNTPVHEYTHIWAKYIMKSDPELWKTIVSTMKKTDMWKQIKKNKNYKGIWENDDQMASEVLSRLSGATSEEEFMKAAATKKGSKAIIDQVKSVLRRFWEAVKRLFGSTGKTIGNVTNSWQSIVRMPLRDLLEGVNPVGEETGTMAQRGDIVQKTLMGVHNISEVKLRKALKQGGLANPSLAVIDTKNGMHNDYGEISLIPKSSLIDSKKGRNAGTFAGDAWTPTYPQVEKIMSDKGLDAYYKDVRNVSENRELTGQLKMVWENYLDGSDPGRLAYWYLKEKGIEPKNSYFDSGYSEEQRKRFAEITDNGSKGFLDMNDEERSGVIAMIAEKEGISLEEKLAKYQALRNKNAEILAKGEKKPFTKILQRTIEEIDKYGITLTPVSDFLYGMKKAINSDGKLNVGGTLQNARDRMQADGMEADFNRWLEEKEQKYGVKEMLFDGFTRDGYRKYIPNTLQNASRMMNREADANSGGQTGFGASRAMLLGKMQSLADIRKQKGKLHGIDEDTQQRYDEASDEMFEVVKALSNMQKISDNPFSNVDYANARLNEALQQKDPISYLNKEYGYNIEKDGDFAKGLKTMLQNVEDLPVKYFETKFKRPVMLDEFTVAIVPENTSAEVVKALQDAGLDVRTYDNTGDEAIRNENRRLATMEAVGMRDDILFHIEDDTETVKRLDNEPTEIGYRNVVLNDDGSLGSPMANRLGKKGVARRPTTMFAFDKWERSDENPDLATEDGKIDLIKPGNKEVGGVDYNPYIHIRPTLVNKQFKQAWERPNLVYIRTKYPVSELDGGYKAEKAKLSVGKHPWGGGELILSRWDKPQEIVPWEEVADDWVKEFQGEKGIHFDIIPPKLLPILVERGMNILPPHKGMGKKCMEAYEKFKSETIRRMAANGNSDASKGRFLFDGESVIDVIGTEFQKSDKSIVDTVSKFFMEEYGGEANRQDIGKILLDNRAVKNDIGHGLNRIKAATFAAVHDIIEQGVIIDKKNEWKGKQTESYIIAAPITIAGERYVGMAIVKRAVDGKRLYLHGVITQKSLQDEALKTDPKVERRQGDVAKILINLHKAKENAKKLQKGGENHQKMIDEVNREAENLGGVKVNIVSSDDIKDENMRHEMHMGTKGIYDPNTGEVSLLVDNIDSIDEAKRVVFHEKLGHEGLKALLGSNEAVMKFGKFLFGNAGKTLRRKMVDRAEEEGWKMDDRERWSKAAQEVFSDIAADGPATPEEFDLWTKAKHYLIRLLKAMNIRIRGLLNDHDLRYYVLKTGDALKWNKLDTSARENLATQETHFEPMRASGKPRKRNNESQAQYFQRLREWERRRIAEEQDPEPQMPEIDNDAMTAEYDEYRKQWNRSHGLPEDYDDMGMPRRESGESDADYMERIRLHEAYEREMQSGDPLQPIFGWEPQAMKDWRQAYTDWKRRNDIREEENVDLNLYEGNGIEPGDPITESEIDARMLRELGEATGTDTTPEGAKHHVKMAIIERRKDLESSNAEDAVFLHQLGKQIAHVAKLQGVKPAELNSALPFIIEDTYFDEIIRDENGNVIAINDISDQLPIKRTPELQSLLDTIKDWYDEFYHVLDDAGLRGKAGYIEEGYVNHVWDKEKSDPKAWEKYVEQYQRLRSPNMKQRMIESYQVGIDLGLKPKFDKLTDIMAYYSKSNNEAVANKGLMQHLSCLNIQEVNSDGEVVLNTPLLYSKQPDGLVRDRYSTFYVPGIGDIWVYKEAASKFANVFGPVTTPGEKAVSQKFWKSYDLIGSTAKKIQLSFSAFHAGALTEVFLAQGMASEGPLRALKELIRGMVYDCIRTGELPAMANPEDFKFAASHLVKLGATDDYAAADVLRLTDKFRQFANDMDKRFGMNKVGVGPLGVVGFAVDAINKGMDTLLWSYLHDGLKIRMMKMFADDLKKKAEKNGWDDDKLDKMFDEAGQYVNDCFGGQYWELIDVSPKLLKGLQRVFLSPDWLMSTMRHFFANFGFGSLYNDGGFWEYVKYNVDNLKRVFGADIPKNDFRAFRSRNAKMCYIIGVLFGAMLLSNLANAIFRKQDEEEEREKAAADPSYKSKYDLIAPDGMKWYDYLMMGNANGQTTHMFIGRYEDGTETYIRWGKQFREFPELWTNEKGELEVPWPLVKRMMGKANPNIGIILDDITYLDPYKATHQDEELQRKYGKPLGLVVKTASKFLPFIVPTQEGKEWKAIDQVFPSSKGFSKWKAQDYFKHYILTDDQQGMELTYKSCVLNGIDPQQQLDAALRSVKAAERQELADGVKDLHGAWEKFNNAQSHTEKLYWQRKLKKYLAESNYDQMNSFEFAEKAKGILGTGDEDMQPMDSKQLKEGEGIYLWLSTAEDVRDDYKVTTLYKKSGEIAKQLRQMEENGQDTSDFEERNDYWLELRERINEYRRDLKEMKLELGGDDSESVMRRIRETRSQLLKEAEELRQ